MVVLSAVVAFLGVLGLLNLLLTFGVVRRLREHTELLGQARGPDVPDVPVMGLATGERVGAFSVTTLDGESLTGAFGLRVAGFFSTGCAACPEQVGPFTEYLAENRVAAENVLSVVMTVGDGLPSYLNRLCEAGRTCVVTPGSEVEQAFKVAGFPAFGLLDADGGLVAASYAVAKLPAAAAVAGPA